MANRLANPFAFEPGESALATMHPLAKLAFLLGIASAAMRSTLGVLLGLFALGLLVLMRLPRVAGGALLSIALLTAFAALVRGILPGDGRLFDVTTLPASGLYALRLLTVYVYSRLFYATTRVSEIGDWMTAAIRMFHRLFRGKNEIRGKRLVSWKTPACCSRWCCASCRKFSTPTNGSRKPEKSEEYGSQGAIYAAHSSCSNS